MFTESIAQWDQSSLPNETTLMTSRTLADQGLHPHSLELASPRRRLREALLSGGRGSVALWMSGWVR